MFLATGAWRKWNIDAFRHTREVLPPDDYLRVSYYEQWFSGLLELLVRERFGHTLLRLRAGCLHRHSQSDPTADRRDKIPAALPNRASCTARRARCPRVSKPGSACVRATLIPSVIHGCRVTLAENSVSSTAIMAFSSFQTRTPTSSARSRSTCTPCASQLTNYGANKRHHRILSTLIYGMTTLTQLDPIREPQVFSELPQLPRDAGGPCLPSRGRPKLSR